MKPGNILLEKYRLGELTDEEMRMLEDAYPDQNEFEREIEKLEASDAEILEKYKPADIAKLIEARASDTKTPGHGGKMLKFFKAARFSAIAAAAVLVLVLGFSLNNKPATESGNFVAASETLSSERIKGLKPSLKIYRRTGDSAEILANRDAANEKDLLQIEYIAGSFKYGVIFSIDGRGTVTLHFPTYSGVAAELDNNGAILLPYAYELDDAPGFERFFFITGGSEFDVDEVLDAAYELASDKRSARREFLDISDSYYQTTILLRKGAE
ncbi:MAG: hypothetical protein PQJ61_12165 [Spirochaetales bacterium]|uniref:DUF4384 domain-containing protein n=1 Tax=Candidatus Thalassospirochaeta sargassi TaxID=3119039 RepID=A0AAJ1MN96_9SPIO|nr:hypothetical protein [Spirochaetales bacterium]